MPVVGQKTSNDEMDGYVIRLRKDAHNIVYVTRMGGSAYDSASRVAVDAQGNAWVAGFTKSSDFAVTADAWQKTYGGDGDAFLVKLSPAGEVLFATFIGGPESDFGNAIVIVNNQPIIGATSNGDCFVQAGPSTRVTFGGSGDDSAWGVAVDKRGRVFIAG